MNILNVTMNSIGGTLEKVISYNHFIGAVLASDTYQELICLAEKIEHFNEYYSFIYDGSNIIILGKGSNKDRFTLEIGQPDDKLVMHQ